MPVSQSGEHLPYAGTPEMDALVASINQNPQSMQLIATDPQLLAEVIKHVSGADVDANDLIQAVSTWPDEAAEASMGEDGAATTDEVVDDEADVDAEAEEVASAPPSPDDDEQGYDEFTKPPDGSAPADDEEADAEVQQAAMPPSRSSAMPRSGGNNPIDDLISAQMMQRAVGNPNAPVPSGAQVGRQMRPAIPQSRMPSGANPQQQMIAEIFRNQGRGATTKKKASKNA